MQKELLKCLYIYDNKFIKNSGRIYSAGRITDEVFKRYVTSKEELTVISRMSNVGNVDNLTPITLDNLTFRPIKGISFTRAFSLYQYYNIPLIAKEIRKSDFIVTRLPSFLGVYGLFINMFIKKPYFVEVVGDAKEALNSSIKDPSKLFKCFSYLFFKSNQYFIKNANGAIYVTKEALQRHYPTNGISSYASNVNINIPEKSLNKKDYSKKGDLFKIGVIADYNNHYKGLAEAIKAISLLKTRGYNVSLHILGSGTLLDYYTSLALEYNVQSFTFFEGRLNSNKEIVEWLQKLDVYIQPSYTEGLPRALIEAMSVGLPAVATNVGGVAELVSDSFLIKPYDYQALADKIEVLLQSQKLRFKIGSLNYDISKDYDKDKLIDRRSEFWQKCRLIVSKGLSNKN